MHFFAETNKNIYTVTISRVLLYANQNLINTDDNVTKKILPEFVMFGGFKIFNWFLQLFMF